MFQLQLTYLKFCPNNNHAWSYVIGALLYPHSTGRGGGDTLFYLCPSVRPKMFITFFSVIIYGSNLIFDHRLQKGQSKVANQLRCPWSSPVEVPSDEGKDINNKWRSVLEGWPQPKICLQITQILHKVDL